MRWHMLQYHLYHFGLFVLNVASMTQTIQFQSLISQYEHLVFSEVHKHMYCTSRRNAIFAMRHIYSSVNFFNFNSTFVCRVWLPVWVGLSKYHCGMQSRFNGFDSYLNEFSSLPIGHDYSVSLLIHSHLLHFLVLLQWVWLTWIIIITWIIIWLPDVVISTSYKNYYNYRQK